MIKILEHTEVNNFISWELLKSYDIYTYILFQMNAYKEETDSILDVIKVTTH